MCEAKGNFIYKIMSVSFYIDSSVCMDRDYSAVRNCDIIKSSGGLLSNDLS